MVNYKLISKFMKCKSKTQIIIIKNKLQQNSPLPTRLSLLHVSHGILLKIYEQYSVVINMQKGFFLDRNYEEELLELDELIMHYT